MSLLQGAEKLKEPATQAVIIAGVSVVVALCCFRVAWLMDRPGEDRESTSASDER